MGSWGERRDQGGSSQAQEVWGGAERFHRYLCAPLFILSGDKVALPTGVTGNWEVCWINHDEKSSPLLQRRLLRLQKRQLRCCRTSIPALKVMSGVSVWVSPPWPSTGIAPFLSPPPAFVSLLLSPFTLVRLLSVCFSSPRGTAVQIISASRFFSLFFFSFFEGTLQGEALLLLDSSQLSAFDPVREKRKSRLRVDFFFLQFLSEGPARRRPAGVNEKEKKIQEWRVCIWWAEWRSWREMVGAFQLILLAGVYFCSEIEALAHSFPSRWTTFLFLEDFYSFLNLGRLQVSARLCGRAEIRPHTCSSAPFQACFLSHFIFVFLPPPLHFLPLVLKKDKIPH